MKTNKSSKKVKIISIEDHKIAHLTKDLLNLEQRLYQEVVSQS